MSNTQPGRPQTVITIPTKNVGLSILLTFLFGSLGLLYTSVIAAIIFIIIELIVGIVTVGFGLIVTHPICMIVGAIMTNNYNKKLLSNRSA